MFSCSQLMFSFFVLVSAQVLTLWSLHLVEFIEDSIFFFNWHEWLSVRDVPCDWLALTLSKMSLARSRLAAMRSGSPNVLLWSGVTGHRWILTDPKASKYMKHSILLHLTLFLIGGWGVIYCQPIFWRIPFTQKDIVQLSEWFVLPSLYTHINIQQVSTTSPQ